MGKKFKVCIAIFLALTVIVQYSFSPQILTAYGEDNQTESVQAAEEKAPEPKPAPKETAAPAPTQAETAAPTEAPEAAEPETEAANEPAGNTTEGDVSASDVVEETEATEETEVTEEEGTEYPAVSFSESAGGMTISIHAPEGALPEGAKVKVTPVSAEQIMGAVESLVGGEIEKVKAADITFYNKDGKEVKPKRAVSVKMNAAGMTADSVVHIADSGAANAVNASTSGSTAAFKTKDFSIYAIVEEGVQDDDARLTVEFVKADGSTTDMMITKNQLDQIELYIYDPGIGTVPEGATFKGWTAAEDYTANTEAKTIADVRDQVKDMLNAGVEEGAKIVFYAMIFNSYTITYLDEEGVTLKNDRLLYRIGDESAHNYTVQLSYTPYVNPESEEAGVTAEFTGWQQISPEVQPPAVYQNGDSIEVTSDIVLRAKVDNGHWLSFNENMAGADYTQPQFVPAGSNPTEPSEPTCTGYTFEGWYTEDASGERDGEVAGEQITDFSSLTLEKNTTLHAKWTENERAQYSILIWKQKASGNGYDFEESVTLQGNAGATINTVTARGNGNDRRAVVNGSEKRYPGFHLDNFDTNVTIRSDGTSVLNVYYNRNQVTFTFVHRANGQWVTDHRMTGLYGSTLESNGYQWPTEYWWYDDYNSVWGVYSGAGTRTTYLESFILSDDGSEATFYGFPGDGTRRVHFLQQNPDGNGYTEKIAVETQNGTFYISDKFSGFHAVQYSTNYNPTTGQGTWTRLNGKNNQGYYGSVSNYNNLYIRYDRDSFKILFMDGVYSTASDPERYNKSDEKLGEVGDIMFGADVSEYKDYHGTQLQQDMHNYVFMGWYADNKCNTLYDFDTMPEGGIVVYAKWLKKEYAVILHNNADGDETFAYNSDSQAEEFWVENGEKIGNVGGERAYYDLVGWYADENFSKAYDFDLFVMNDDTVRTLGTLYSESEINPQYPNTVGEINLYAKWRSKLIGAKGINIVYDATDEGTNAPVDDKFYVDKSEAIAAGGATSTNEDKVFSHWVVQKWNGSAYVDTDVKVFPGDTFTVLADDAKITDDNDGDKVVTKDELVKDGSYTYTVQLKAVYIEKDKETLTYINWYDNYSGNKVAENTDLKINEAVDIPAAPTRPGYEFKGWIRGIDEDGPTTDLTELYLTYEDGSYTQGDKTVTQVAADEKLVGDGTQHHAMYAKWEAVDVDYTVKFFYQDENGEYVEDTDLQDVRQASVDAEVAVTDEDKAQTKDDAYVLNEDKNDKWNGTVAAEGTTVLELYFDLAKTEVTVEHYLLGEETAFKTDVVEDQSVGSTYEATPETTYEGKTLTVDSYDPSQSITVESSDNVIKIYYTMPLTITAKTDSKTYDGEPLDGEYTIEGALEADEAAIEEALGEAPSITDVADSPKEYLTEDEQAEITGIPAYYEVTYTPGTLTIDPATVTVTITGNTDTQKYNGEEQSVEGYEVEIDNELYSQDDFSPVADAAAKGTNAGTYEMGLTKDMFTNNNDNFEVEFAVTDGSLTIEKRVITIESASDSKVYDGTALTRNDPDSDITIGGDGLANKKDLLIIFSDDATITDVGSVPNAFDYTFNEQVSGNAIFDVIFKAAEEGSMADNYEVEKKEGTLEVTPATLKVKTPSKSKAYDGEALTAEGSVDGLVNGETVTFKTTGSQTEVGSSENTYELTWDGTAKESNYTVQEDLGKLTVTAANDDEDKDKDKDKKDNKKSEGAATGDNTNLFAGLAALLFSALGLCGAFLIGRRRKEEN